jgi:hypothetical protein
MNARGVAGRQARSPHLMLRSALSRPLRHSARVSFRKFHSRVPQPPLALSNWSEPTGDGLVPIVVEQTVCTCGLALPTLFHFPPPP